MDIKVTDNEVIVKWLGVTSICDFDELVEQFKKADEQERKRLVVIFFSSELFRPVKEEKQVIKSRKLLSINNYCDLASHIPYDDFDLEDNPHWIVE